MERLEIDFDFATPSQNKLHGWRARYGWRQKFLKYFANYFLVKKYVANEMRTLTITRHGKRLLDYGNLVGGCKPLLDALKEAKLIVDDSPKWLIDSYSQQIGKPKAKIILTWETK